MSDKKDAVNIGVTLSGQLITAALAMIAVVGTFAAFIIDKRNVGLGYYLIAGGSFLSFVVSIIFGGKGINQARKDGFTGNWNLSNTKKSFNKQSIAAFFGIVLFAISVFFGKEKADDLKNNFEKQNQVITKLRRSDSLTKIKVAMLEIKLDSLRKTKNCFHSNIRKQHSTKCR
ncbi:hypothetical protein [Mucilaginibacter sp.]|jgi:hypothetical protein|uniref:hypothetical protein n=1 Tax=Mucilaginibacter sp. TaxID=1882438 RepID=UPI00261ABBAD|nr:hypothetical protein [Mucilaginibacter sp.]MDB4926596.1 hypothetical protein [Mucilaginibacter sp.]